MEDQNGNGREPTVEELESSKIYRELKVESEGDALKFCHDLLDYMDGQKAAQKAWGSFTIKMNYRGKGLDSVDITDQHSIRFKSKSES